MLVLSRREFESLVIGDNIVITVLEINGQVRLGIDAPKEVNIVRAELLKRQENYVCHEEFTKKTAKK